MTRIRIPVLLALFLFCAPLWAQPVDIRGVRMWPAPDNTRIVFDLSGAADHRLFTLDNPDRIVIDLKGARLTAALSGLDYGDGVLQGIRSAPRNQNDLRIVLDLKRGVRPKSFALTPMRDYGHRLVIDLFEKESAAAKPARTVESSRRDLVVAIDAGHGGEDPGAIGPRGTREKDVVLAIARILARRVDAEPGMRAVLVRDGDYFVSLRNRVEKARQHKADLFISIHADAFHDRRARGASVYTLSRGGSTSEHARLLAQKENASDLIGGVSLDDKDNLLASVLLDLSQTATLEASADVATRVLGRMQRTAHLHKRQVEKAGFRVLKAPDIPSILVETAFISNPQEEAKLRSASYQAEMAGAILEGVREHFLRNPPPGTLMAERAGRTHTIARGETLSTIAQRYSVSLQTLRSVNGISGDMVQAGAVIRIPGS